MTRKQDVRPDQSDGVSRRAVLAVGATGATALTLAACSKAPSPNQAQSSAASTTAGGASSAVPTGGAASSSKSSSPGATTQQVLAKLSDIPVGSAVAAKGTDGSEILISRTSDTAVAGFSAICPHQGCTVAPSFVCPCHGSTFDSKTGARVSGPTPTGLSTVAVAISGQNIVAG
jgi:cytochrome b6-f complex iron-sulfur subunit